MKKYLLTLISIMVLTVFAIEANAQCTVTISQPVQLTAEIGGGGVYCSNADVTFTVEVAGGTAPYYVTYGSTTLEVAPFTFTFQLTEDTTIDEADITVTDAHGCPSITSGSAIFTIEDVPPSVTCATIRNLEGCGTDAITGPAFSTTLALSSVEEFENSDNNGSADDACGIQKVEYQDVLGTSTCPLTVTRTWTITDNSGNEITCDQTITVDDTKAPDITEAVNDDLVIECDEDIDALITAWLANHAGATATDECVTTVDWSHNYTVLAPGCGSTGSAEVTFEAKDACLNTSSFTATITVQDITAPIITAEAEDEFVQCDGNGNVEALNTWLENHGGATATDNCGDVFWSYTPAVPVILESCGEAGYVDVTFRVTDECGVLFSETTARFTIEDGVKPVIDITDKDDLIIECADNTMNAQIDAWLADHAGATATDVCSGDDITWSHNYDGLLLSDGCGNTGEMTVTFTATDDCNNFETTTAKIIISDETAPEITKEASDKTVECDGLGNVSAFNAWLDSNGGASASDLCGNVTWTNNYTALDPDCGSTGTVTVTFTAKDECNNEATTSATFTIEDTTPPSITCPANIVADAAAGTTSTAVDVPLPDVDDTCGDVTYINNYTGTQNASGDYPLGVTTVTYTVTDDCGKTNTCSFTVTVLQLPAFTTEFEDVQCFEGNDGWIKVIPNSGTAPYRYSKDNGATYTEEISEPYYIFENLPADTYEIRIKDANNHETPICE